MIYLSCELKLGKAFAFAWAQFDEAFQTCKNIRDCLTSIELSFAWLRRHGAVIGRFGEARWWGRLVAILASFVSSTYLGMLWTFQPCSLSSFIVVQTCFARTPPHKFGTALIWCILLMVFFLLLTPCRAGWWKELVQDDQHDSSSMLEVTWCLQCATKNFGLSAWQTEKWPLASHLGHNGKQASIFVAAQKVYRKGLRLSAFYTQRDLQSWAKE